MIKDKFGPEAINVTGPKGLDVQGTSLANWCNEVLYADRNNIEAGFFVEMRTALCAKTTHELFRRQLQMFVGNLHL